MTSPCWRRTSTTRRASPTRGCARCSLPRPRRRGCSRCSSGRRSRVRGSMSCPQASPSSPGLARRRPTSRLGHGLQDRAGQAGDKVAYVRLFTGTVRTRDPVAVGRGAEHKVTAISVFERGAAVQCSSFSAGQIAKVWGLGNSRVSDAIGLARPAPEYGFAPPTLETVVEPRRGAGRGALHTALTLLAEQDPLISVRQDELRGELSVSLFGEVQKEVIEATLADDFGVEVAFREDDDHLHRGGGQRRRLRGRRRRPQPVPRHHRASGRPRAGRRRRRVPPRGGARVDAVLVLRRGRGDGPQTLQQGLYGWEVPDCTVTMTHSGYWPRQSHAHAMFDKSMSSTATATSAT